MYSYLCIREQKWSKWGKLVAITHKLRKIRPDKKHKIRWYNQKISVIHKCTQKFVIKGG